MKNLHHCQVSTLVTGMRENNNKLQCNKIPAISNGFPVKHYLRDMPVTGNNDLLTLHITRTVILVSACH